MAKLVEHSSLHLVKKHFTEDKSKYGLKKAVQKETKSAATPRDLQMNLNKKYAYFNWDVAFVPATKDKFNVETRASINCGSHFYPFEEVDKNAVVAWSIPSLAKTKISKFK